MEKDLYNKLKNINYNREYNFNGVNIERFNGAIGEEAIKKFIDVVTSNLPIKNLQLFYNNINTLDIKLMKKGTVKYLNGSYSINKNNIRVRKNPKNGTIWHELNHMASSYHDKNNKIEFCGFKANEENSNYNILGEGLNEGYTEVLTSRYFQKKVTSYWFLALYSFAVEKIVGREKMENFYYNANLLELIDELSKYQDNSKAVHLIKKLDEVKYYLYGDCIFFHKNVTSDMAEVNELLIETYTNKLKIDNEYSDEKLESFIQILPTSFKRKNKQYNIDFNSKIDSKENQRKK